MKVIFILTTEQLINIVIHNINTLYIHFNKKYYSKEYNHGTFTSLFNSHFDNFQNLRKMSIHEFMHDSYFTNCLITNYIESVKLDVIPEMVINQFDYKAKNYPLTFRQRTKVIDSTNRKIKDYLKRENTNDPFKVAKSINDLYGCRIVLNGVNINSKGITKLLSNLRNKGIIYRYYHRDDHGYKAFHCYFQNRNIYFPWELQIWDKSDRAMNVNLHKGHALRRKKRLEA